MKKKTVLNEMKMWSVDFKGIEEKLEQPYGRKVINTEQLSKKYDEILCKISGNSIETYNTLKSYYLTTDGGKYLFNKMEVQAISVDGVSMFWRPSKEEKEISFNVYDVVRFFEEKKYLLLPEELNEVKDLLVYLIPFSDPLIYKCQTQKELEVEILEKQKELAKKVGSQILQQDPETFFKNWVCIKRMEKEEELRKIFDNYCQSLLVEHGAEIFHDRMLQNPRRGGEKLFGSVCRVFYNSLSHICDEYLDKMDRLLRFRIAERYAFCKLYYGKKLDENKSDFIQTGDGLDEDGITKYQKEYSRSQEFVLKNTEDSLKNMGDARLDEKEKKYMDPKEYVEKCENQVAICLNHLIKFGAKEDYKNCIADLFKALNEWYDDCQSRYDSYLILENYEKLCKQNVKLRGNLYDEKSAKKILLCMEQELESQF